MKAARVIELLSKVPEDADIDVYEGEDSGIHITSLKKQLWWISVRRSEDVKGSLVGFSEPYFINREVS